MHTSPAKPYENEYLEQIQKKKINCPKTIKEPPTPPLPSFSFLASGCFFFPELCGFFCWNVTVRLRCSTAHSFEVTSAASSEPHTAPNDLDGLNEIKHYTVSKRTGCNRLLYWSMWKKQSTQATLNVQFKNSKIVPFYFFCTLDCWQDVMHKTGLYQPEENVYQDVQCCIRQALMSFKK